MRLTFTKPITDIIQERRSCRSYAARPVEPEIRRRLAEIARGLGEQADGSRARFELVAADEADLRELRRLGTYGFIRGASAFLVGVVPEGASDLEELGALMEKWVLFASGLGLGTCWLGGTFNRSSFARKAGAGERELIPAVIACGYPAGRVRQVDRLIRRQAGSDRRLPWRELFFAEDFGTPLTPQAAGDFTVPLEMVRLAPSASNKQPWRVLKKGRSWHFVLKRTPGYREALLNRMFAKADLQRIDLGIAMCHFELTCRALGLPGKWMRTDPDIHMPDGQTEHTATWVEDPE